MTESDHKQQVSDEITGLPPALPNKNVPAKDGFTPEMMEVVEALAHPKGDPYNTARKLGLYCEQCG